jgi:hypothetical protein
VDAEKPGEMIHDENGERVKKIPDFTLEFDTGIDEYKIEKDLCGGAYTRSNAAFRKLGFDLTIVEEESVGAADLYDPLDIAIAAENKKWKEYEGFHELNGYIVIPVAITTRGTCGPGANATLDLLIEFSKRKRRHVNIG